MKKPQPIFDPMTHYRIEVRGRVDVEWLQGFDNTAEISLNEGGEREDITEINVHADQSGVVGLLRTLHGLGLTIQHLQVMPCTE